MISLSEAVEKIELEWDQIHDGTFFGDLKRGVFNESGFERLKHIFDSIEYPVTDSLDKRFVEVTWFIPVFMRWQIEEWKYQGKRTDLLEGSLLYFEQRLTTILGLP